MEAKEEFIKIYNEKINREGAKALLDYLLSTDFFTAPASTKFHSSHRCGLVEHSVNTYNRFKKLVMQEYGENYQDKVSDESIAIISLLHDICKTNTYKEAQTEITSPMRTRM